MDAKITSNFWRDPDYEGEAPEVKLAAIWVITNADIVGLVHFSARTFTFDTNCHSKFLDHLMKVQSKSFKRLNGFIWAKNWIRHQIGDGASLSKNNFNRSIFNRLDKLPTEIRGPIFAEYPILAPLYETRMEVTNPTKKPRGTKNPEPKTGKRADAARVLLTKMNEIGGRQFMAVDVNMTLIIGRLKEVDDDVNGCIVMMERLWSKWKETKWAEFFQPKTVFGMQKFHSYYGVRNIAVNADGGDIQLKLDALNAEILVNPGNSGSAYYAADALTAEQKTTFQSLTKKRDALLQKLA